MQQEHDSEETDAIVFYLNQKRKSAMQYLEQAMGKARSLFDGMGKLQISEDETIEMKAIEQLSRTSHKLRVPCWYWENTPVHYDQHFVDEVEENTQCQATIFQRIPEGFIRISTNIRNMNGRRAVGTYISNESKVAQSILQKKSYDGSAFVLNNWYLSVYDPILINDEVVGILYVGRKESLELMPARSLSEEKVEQVFERLQAIGAFQSEINDHGSGELIRALSQLPDFALHPLINLGLKEISALMVQEKERHNASNNLGESPEFHHIIEYIKSHLTEDISVDVLTEHLYMSKASLYRYFKKKFNTTPKSFITQERLRQACLLMQKKKGIAVHDLSNEVGFHNTSYFIKVFKEHYGVTPKQYQKQL